MRFGKYLRLVVRFAAAGGAVMVLAGSAAAADSTANTAPTIPQKPDQAPTQNPVSGALNVQNQLQNTITDIKDVQGANSGSTVSTDKTTQDTSGSVPQQNTGTGDSNDKAVTPSNTSTLAPGNIQAGAGASVQPLKDGVTSSQGNNPDTAKPASVGSAQISAGPEPAAIRFRSEMLRVQPTIVSHYSAPIDDLASTIPSAPAQQQKPSPAKSSGALGRLTAVLAGTVVPQPLSLHGDLVPVFAAALGFMTLIMLLVNVFVFKYGLWLRRGGFATAARSDAPLFAHLSYLATPLFLGYVSTPVRRHNPIFVVADTQHYLKYLAPMLTERRICI